MRTAPQDILTSLFCTRRILVFVRERITPHFLFECHYATLRMFEGTVLIASSKSPNICQMRAIQVSRFVNRIFSCIVASMFALACFRAVTLRTATAPTKRQAIHSETLLPPPRVLHRPAPVRHAKAARP